MGFDDEDALIQDNIQEFVNDDNKIVTCKWLSLTLSIPVNSAKQALVEFVSNTRNSNKNDDINVTYFVSGFYTKEGNSKILKCVVVPESHLDSLKKTLNPVTSCHVYSVQKSQLKDYTPLYQADYDICRGNKQALSKLSSISCPWATLHVPQDDGDASVTKPITKAAQDPKPAPTSSSTWSSSKTSSVAKTTQKKGGIASMFAAAEKFSKKPGNTSSKESNKKTNDKDSSGAESKKGIQSFLKGNTTTSKPTKAKETSPKVEESTTTTKQKSPKVNESKASKHKLSEKTEPKKKRRRRIRNDLFDSSDEEKNEVEDDDDEEEEEPIQQKDEEDDDVIVESEEEEEKEDVEVEKKVNSKEEIKEKKKEDREDKKDESKSGKRRKRTRKLVPKQHIDEDGFMVTEKVWESDSTDASDDEDTTKPTKVESPAKSNKSPIKRNISPAPKSAPPIKKKPATSSSSSTKQASLMSFFKRK